jgi:hypothetical protein
VTEITKIVGKEWREMPKEKQQVITDILTKIVYKSNNTSEVKDGI